MNRRSFVRFCLSVVAVVFLLAPPAFLAYGQNPSPVPDQSAAPEAKPKKVKRRLSDEAAGQNLLAPTAPSCGPADVSYRVHLNDNPQPDASPQSGKALVYFIQDEETDGYITHTTQLALDGKWVGANQGTSYFSVSVDPGVHHVCADTRTVEMGPRIELAHFTAEAGQTYYYQTKLILTRYQASFDLTPVDSDEGIYLARSFPSSVSQPKK